MGDTEQPDDRRPASLPVPRDPPDAGPDADHPGTREAWATARAQVAGMLLAPLEAELEDGAVLPAPLAGGVALRAGATASRSGSGTADGRRALDVVGHAERVLGTRLCCSEAVAHECEPERLVAQLARVRGALSTPDPVAARTVWRALRPRTRSSRGLHDHARPVLRPARPAPAARSASAA